MSVVPVFLISFNRGAMLERAIDSLKRLDQHTQIIIQDNGSTDPLTLAVLERLEGEGAQVVHREPINSADELNLVDETVSEFFANRPHAPYVVSDCDIDIGIADRRALSLYAELLDLFPAADCVGPMLRIRDVPVSYPLYNRMMNRHIDQFWKRRPSWVETSLGRVAYIEAPFDTTLALHRAGEPFKRFKAGLRVYEPYEALHLDWYIGPESTDIYNTTSRSGISHWNNAAERDLHSGVLLEYSSYYAVRSRQDGLEEYEEFLPLRP